MTFIGSIQRLKKIFTLIFLTSAIGVLAFQQPLIMAQGSSTPSSVQSSLSIVTLFNQAQHSIVQVTSKSLQNTSEIGSGFVYDRAGHVLTASHVVDGSKIVDVTFIDGSRYSANVVGTDPYSDLAVLQITDKINNEALNPLMLGNSSKLEVGEPVIAIGHSFPGVGLENTLTTGVISQTKYILSLPEFGVFMPNAIQTDAAINPGNSGGPLLNLQGQVIGMSIGRINPVGVPNGQFSGLSVAGPSNSITRIIPVLIGKGTYVHPSLGLVGTTLDSDLAKTVKGFAGNLKGVVVNSILKNGPADKAGIQPSIIDKYSVSHGGDVITAIDRHAVVQVQDLMSYIEQNKTVGDNVTLTVYRDGQSLHLTASLAGRTLPVIYQQKISSPV